MLKQECCMHALARHTASFCSRQLASRTSTGVRVIHGSQTVSDVVMEGRHSMASSSTEAPATQPKTLWEQLVTPGKPDANGTGQKSRRQQGPLTGSGLGLSGNKSAGPKLKANHGRSQTAAQARPGKEGTTELGHGSVIMYFPASFPAGESAALYQRLQDTVEWQAREVTVMGRRVMQPRLVAYMADHAGLSYTYSGSSMVPLAWNDAVLRIKKRVEELSGATFNSCLLNFYRSGMDHLSFHSDNEPLYGRGEYTIGSASFGSSRDFILRSNTDHSNKISYPLGSGDILTMKGTLQQHWMHSIPRRKRVSGGRISLTFRNIVHPEMC